MIKAVIFDMDGVLVDSEEFMRESAIISLRRYGINPSHGDFSEFTGMGEDMFIGGVARKHGLEYTTDMKDYAYDYYARNANQGVIVFPHAKEVLEKVKGMNLKVAVASAADLIKVTANLSCIGVDTSFFDAVVTGSDVTKKKPDPETFLKAAEKLDINPSDCIVIEDAISGIKAAKAAGMKNVGITTSFDEASLKAAQPDHVVKDILEAFEMIQGEMK
jgi:beta-phosphoglucomutase